MKKDNDDNFEMMMLGDNMTSWLAETRMPGQIRGVAVRI